MFLSFIVGGSLLMVEGLLATFTFGPDRIEKLYNENFLKVPFVSQIVNFYPMLAVSAVPVLIITMRNNLF